MKIVSACLTEINCRWDGESTPLSPCSIERPSKSMPLFAKYAARKVPPNLNAGARYSLSFF